MPRTLYNHVTASLSALDLRMVKCVPPGGNWRNIDPSIPSKRLDQIREGVKGGSRSTYYGRLDWEKPAYTINTLFNRPGNGCFIHPVQDRMISQREAARLQSFLDSYRFFGSKTSIYKQIGNAVPPLLAYAVGKLFAPADMVDLFCGAGGMSLGMELAGHRAILGVDIDQNMVETYRSNRSRDSGLPGNLRDPLYKNKVIEVVKSRTEGKALGLLVGGPPCQGFSPAGNKRSPDDPRNALYREFIDVVKSLRPVHFVMEQIPSARNLDKGRFYDQMMKDFGALADYTVTPLLLKAEEFGVPQLRRRIFLVGSRSGEVAPPGPAFGPGLRKPITVREAISDLPSLPMGGGSEALSYDEPENLSPYALWVSGRLPVTDFIGPQVPYQSAPA